MGVLVAAGRFRGARRGLGTRRAPSRSSCASAEQLAAIDGLVIPGGESTTMLKLLRFDDLLDALAEFGRRKPVFGTCAGAILLARRGLDPAQESLGLMDIAVERNAYGRQIDSRVADARSRSRNSRRAPPREAGSRVHPRAHHPPRGPRGAACWRATRATPSWWSRAAHLVATFHPELTADSRVHELFLEKL